MATARKPFSLQVIAPAYPAFQEACVLIRSGYIFAPDMPVELTETGQAIFTLILGTPDQAAIDAAKGSIDHGLQMEAAAYERDVQARAKVLLEDYKREQLAAQVAALKAQQAKEVAALEKATEQAIAAL